VPQAREDVIERTGLRRREPHAARRHDRHAKRRGEIEQRLQIALLVAAEVTLHFHPDLPPPEDPDEAIDQPADAVPFGLQHLPSRERDEPGGLPRKIVEGHRRLALRRAQLRARDHAAEISVAFGGGDEDRECPRCRPRAEGRRPKLIRTRCL
jgi:hypothetical protein